jgi:transposase
MRDPKTKPRTRERLEMIRLSAAGMSIPSIAPIVGQSEGRVRHWVKAFLEQQTFDALDDRPHPGMASRLTPGHLSAIRAEIEKGERTWSAPQVAVWLEETQGVRLSADQVRRKLKGAGIVWKRTGRSLRHKQKPQEVEAKRAELEALEKKGPRARLTCATWTKPGSR